MFRARNSRTILAGSACAAAISASALAADFNIPDGELKTTLDAYMKQAGVVDHVSRR